MRAREMAQMSRVLDPLSEELGSIAKTQMAAAHNHHNSSSKGSNSLFWSPQAPGTHDIQPYMKAKHSHAKEKLKN